MCRSSNSAPKPLMKFDTCLATRDTENPASVRMQTPLLNQHCSIRLLTTYQGLPCRMAQPPRLQFQQPPLRSQTEHVPTDSILRDHPVTRDHNERRVLPERVSDRPRRPWMPDPLGKHRIRDNRAVRYLSDLYENLLLEIAEMREINLTI